MALTNAEVLDFYQKSLETLSKCTANQRRIFIDCCKDNFCIKCGRPHDKSQTKCYCGEGQ